MLTSSDDDDGDDDVGGGGIFHLMQQLWCIQRKTS